LKVGCFAQIGWQKTIGMLVVETDLPPWELVESIPFSAGEFSLESLRSILRLFTVST